MDDWERAIFADIKIPHRQSWVTQPWANAVRQMRITQKMKTKMMMENMLDGKVMRRGGGGWVGRLASVVSLLRGFNWRAPALANNPHLSVEPCNIYTFPNWSTTFPFFLLLICPPRWPLLPNLELSGLCKGEQVAGVASSRQGHLVGFFILNLTLLPLRPSLPNAHPSFC